MRTLLISYSGLIIHIFRPRILSLRPRILPARVTHVTNVSTFVNKSHKVDCPCASSFDVSTTADPDPMDVLKSYDEVEGSTLFIFPMLKENVVVFISFLFMAFVFSFRTIFIFCSISTFRFSVFIVNGILTFLRYCYYFIYTNIGYIIYYNFLMILTNSLSDLPSKLNLVFTYFKKYF